MRSVETNNNEKEQSNYRFSYLNSPEVIWPGISSRFKTTNDRRQDIERVKRMSSTNSEESIKIISFDGSKDSMWRMWDDKMRAIGTIKGWVTALDADPRKGLDLKNPQDDKERAEVKVENGAKLYLTLA